MIETRTLSQMLEANRVAALVAAVAASLDALMVGVAVTRHPGKLDIADVLAGDVVKTPGVTVGWSRIRNEQELDGPFRLIVDLTAYIATEDTADLVAKRRTDRSEVAQAIGGFVLEILHDADAASWGLTGIAPPEDAPRPELKPVFTAKSYAKGTAYYAVTWSQCLHREGEPFMPVGRPPQPDGADTLHLVGGGGMPPELRALIGAEDAE